MTNNFGKKRRRHQGEGIEPNQLLNELLCDGTVSISLGAERPSMTFGAVVCECSVSVTLRVTMGPPHLVPFHRVDW